MAFFLCVLNLHAQEPALLPSSKGYTGVLSTPVAGVLPDNQGTLTFGRTDSLRKITGIQSMFGFWELGGSITGDPGDLGLNSKFLLPVVERNGYRLSFALGGVDIAGGRVVDRYYYGVGSLTLPHVRFTMGSTHDGHALAGIEVEPLIPWARLLLTEKQSGMALVAPGWGSAQLAVDRKSKNRTWIFAFQRPLDSLLQAPAPQTRGNWRLHYELYPELFDVVAVEVGAYHYQWLLAHNVYLLGIPHWRAAAQVRQPLENSRELETGRTLSRFREDGVALRQTTLVYDRSTDLGVGKIKAEAALGTYAVDWWFWRAALRWSFSRLALAGYVAYFDNPRLEEYRVVWVPSATWALVPGRYGVRLYGGDFWEQDRGLGFAFQKYLGSTTVSLDAQRVYVPGERPTHFIGATVAVALCLPRDVELGTRRITANGPRSWDYTLRTRLITPGSPNTVAPLAATEPRWLLAP